MQGTLSIGVCVPTVREAQISEFLVRWGKAWSTEVCSRYDIRLFVHEDNPERTFAIDAPTGISLRHTCHHDIIEELGTAEWIVPRRSAACRSFPMYLAWHAGCDYVLTLDDDCYPVEGEGHSFIDTHLAAFAQDRWFRTIDGETPRGVPYGDRGQLPVLLNHGLWRGVPDLDGPTSLVHIRRPVPVVLRAARDVVPPGMYFPLCCMNVCYHRSVIPAAYNLLMGLDAVGFDRFDDIWSGLLLKRIADHLGWYITSGVPFVEHVKASNPFANVRKEALGIALHEYFWRHIDAAQLTAATSITQCYAELATWVRRFAAEMPNAPCPGEYFERLAEAMQTWLRLFDSTDGAL